MITKTTLAIIVATATIGIATPVLAQYRNSGEDAFAMVPRYSTIAPANNPAATGGGSSGYNDNLLKDQW
jgi:hypothetical protein